MMPSPLPLPLLSESRAGAARRDTCTLNSVTSCPRVLDTFRFRFLCNPESRVTK